MFCSVSIPLFFSLIVLNLEGNVWDKRGDKVLNRKVNHKLSRGTQVSGRLGFSYRHFRRDTSKLKGTEKFKETSGFALFSSSPRSS